MHIVWAAAGVGDVSLSVRKVGLCSQLWYVGSAQTQNHLPGKVQFHSSAPLARRCCGYGNRLNRRDSSVLNLSSFATEDMNF